MKTLEDDQVEEGDSLTFSCKSSAHISSPTQKPQFVKSLSDHEVEEGESLTLSCTTQNITDKTTELFSPKFVKGKVFFLLRMKNECIFGRFVSYTG